MNTRNDDERQAVAHWLDRNYGSSVRASEWLGGGPNGGHDWLAAADDVLEVARKNRQGSQNPAQGGRTGAQGTPGGPEVSEGADGASVRSLGDRLRAAADYQDRPGAYDELRAMADEADRLQNERDAIDESLWRFKESFHEVLGGKPLAEWHAENCGAVEGAEQMRRDRDQARGDLAAQEQITAELRGQRDESNAVVERLRPVAQLVHTVQTRGGVGDVAGVRIERVQDGTTATERRLEEARAAVERVRGLLGDGELFTPMDSWDAGEVFHAESVRDLIGDLREALDGGTGAGHVHRWLDQTTHADRKRLLVCTIEGCGEEREEER